MAPLGWHLETVVFDYGLISGASICWLLAVIYVGSLYLFNQHATKSRDDAVTIKDRFFRVTCVCLFVIPLLWLASSSSHSVKARPLFIWLGLRFKGIIFATVLPLFLTMVLFSGPLTLHYLDGIFKIYKDPQYWIDSMNNLIWLRNHVVAPLTEEWIFRACMLPIIVPRLGEDIAVLVVPIFFGVAHFHHMIEKVRAGQSFAGAFSQCLFQFMYTSLFGTYSAYLFLRTGHLVAPVLAHAFCNHMGFPDFEQVLAYKSPTKFYIIFMFVIGLVVWWQLLEPLTSPWLYANDLYYVH